MEPKLLPDSNRKATRRVAEIDPNVLAALNDGLIETKNLVEWLAIDVRQLWAALGFAPSQGVEDAAMLGVVGRNQAMGRLLLGEVGYEGKAYDRLAGHASDMVRGWAAYAVAAAPDLDFADRVTRVNRFASDPHMGLRECAWDVWRPHFGRDPARLLADLKPLVHDEHEGVRRVAIEGTRPNGVWTKRIPLMKTNPELALDLLEPLKSDPSRYVQNAVANWLNDAGKTRPEFVMDLTERWLTESPTKETAYIVKRARRSF